ncbi:GIY-YIG nuclease family protein [Kocuria turfanensis]|uniref:GIY-YIG domain-containing protein n=1 Tax=Kocuria turfanensis TaxID=388357 RepID=A0A512IH47_9MICC|nr:GIY-YIG nuclease family protein [Kocuria turfanensis]GEO96987.1 hypothetical protein KTU01_31100 [Kocuria turfanensis]
MTQSTERLEMIRVDVRDVDSLSAVSNAFSAGSSRCGIYVLHFAGGYEYVGQAQDVLARFRTHVRSWSHPVVALDFAPVPVEELNETERRVIQAKERAGVRLRNSALVGLPMGDAAVDVHVTRAEQERWLDGVTPDIDVSGRCTQADGRDRSGKNFTALALRPYYDVLLDILAAYVRHVLPAPESTEKTFWYVSAMPSTGRTSTWQRVAAITVNNVETLVIGETTENGRVFLDGFLNVAPGLRLPSTLNVELVEYRTVGQVQTIRAEAAFLEFAVYHPLVRDAARTTAMGLLRKGTSMMGRYHCVPLADDIFRRIHREELAR